MYERLSKRQQKARTRDRIAEWQRMNTQRRRLAGLAAERQRRLAFDALARDGLYLVRLPELVDDLAELSPPCL